MEALWAEGANRDKDGLLFLLRESRRERKRGASAICCLSTLVRAVQARRKTLCYIAKMALRVRQNCAHADAYGTEPRDRACRPTENPSCGSAVARCYL